MSETGPLAESDARYLDAILADVEPLLGPGIVVERFERERDESSWRLKLFYRLGSVSTTSEGIGDSVVAAHAALRDAVVVDRISLSVRALISG